MLSIRRPPVRGVTVNGVAETAFVTGLIKEGAHEAAFKAGAAKTAAGHELNGAEQAAVAAQPMRLRNLGIGRRSLPPVSPPVKQVIDPDNLPEEMLRDDLLPGFLLRDIDSEPDLPPPTDLPVGQGWRRGAAAHRKRPDPNSVPAVVRKIGQKK